MLWTKQSDYCEISSKCLACFIDRVTAHADLDHSINNLEHVDAPTSMALHFINKKDAKGLTPLHVALSLKNQCIKNAITLILSGADVHVRSVQLCSPSFLCSHIVTLCIITPFMMCQRSNLWTIIALFGQ